MALSRIAGSVAAMVFGVGALLPGQVSAGGAEFGPTRHASWSPAVELAGPPVCLGACRRPLAPCRVGSRWYGPYGYVCYKPERPAALWYRAF
jgi:hypothetical protein